MVRHLRATLVRKDVDDAFDPHRGTVIDLNDPAFRYRRRDHAPV